MNHWYDSPVSPLRGSVRSVCVLFLVGYVLMTAGSATGQEPEPAVQKESASEGLEKSTGSAKEPKLDRKATSPAKKTTSAKKQPTLAIINATIHTLGPQGVIEDGVILVTGETISAVGKDLEVPEGAEQIDASGLNVSPGLIDASSRLWLTPAAASSTASDASLNVLDGVDRFDEQWHEVIRHGITTVYVQPGRSGSLSGYGAVLSVAADENGPVVHSKYAAVQASIGIGAANNQARIQQLDRTKKALKAAVEYQEKWDKYNAYLKKQSAEKKASEKKGVDAKEKTTTTPKSDDSKAEKKPASAETDREPADKSASSNEAAKNDGKKEEKPPTKPEKDAAQERLAKVADGQIPMRLEINTADDAYYGLELLKEFPDLQIVLTGLTDLRSATDSIQALGVPVVVGPWLTAESNYRTDPDSASNWGDAFSSYEGTLVIASGGTSARSSRLLRAHAGRAVAAGIDADTALAAITINAARTLGVADAIGSITVGKRADLAGFRGHPLDASAPVSFVLSGGKVVHNTSAGDTSPNADERIASQAPETVLDILGSIDATRLAIRSQNCLKPDGTTAPNTIIIDRKRGIIVGIEPVDAEFDATVQVVDFGDAWITPGLFSSHATLGLSGLVDPQLSDATYVVAADGVSIGFDGEKERVDEGMLRALLTPSDSNTLAGSASVIRLGAKEQVMSRVAAFKFSMTDSARSINRFPSSLAGQSQLIRQSLRGELLDTRLYIPAAAQQRLADERKNRLKAIADGSTLAIVSASSDADLRAALDLIESHKLTAAITGAQQLAPFIDRLKSLDVTVVAKPVTASDFDWYCKDLADASNAGVSICFAGENAEQLRLTAALATESGMSSTAALRGMCYGPSKTKSSEESYADFVIWSQSPLNLSATPLCVMVDGKILSTQLDQRGNDEN